MNTYTGRESLEEQFGIVAACAAKLPGVVIIHNIMDWTVTWMSEKGLKGLEISLEEVYSLAHRNIIRGFSTRKIRRTTFPRFLACWKETMMTKS